ncbi:MAG: tetratricopeptide repeat protein [Xanthomonadales bacterium]|nr:tetratricopeptide repeat protein [Xanthomonadales bacterium]
MDDIEQLIAGDQLEPARAQLDAVRQRQPRLPRLAFLDAVLAAREGRFREASALLVELLADVPDHALAQLLQGRLQHRLGQREAAARRFDDALTLDPRLAAGAFTPTEIAVLDADMPALARRYRDALAADGEDIEARLGLAGLLLRQQQYSVCLFELEPLLSKARPVTGAVQLAAVAEMLQGQHAQALARLQAVEEPPLAFALLRLQILFWARRLRDADAVAEEILQQHPDLGQVWVLRGEILLAGSALMRTVEAAQEALRLCPEHARAVRALALATMRMGETNAAESLVRQHLQRHPHDAVSWRMLLALLTHQQNHEAAIAAARQWIEASPDEADAHADLSALLEHEGDLDAAMQTARAALRLRSDHINALLVAARAELRIGRPGPVLGKLDRVSPSELEPGQREARLVLLARSADAQGQYEQAVQRWRERHSQTPYLSPTALLPKAATLNMPPAAPPLPQHSDRVAFLLGLPGSGVQHLAASLQRHPALAVMTDRFGGPTLRHDGFSQPDWLGFAQGLSEGQALILRRRWRKAVARTGQLPTARLLIDWMPFADLLSYTALARVFPGAPVIVVERNPADCLLDWLAFPGMHRLRFDSPAQAGEWLAMGQGHLSAIAASDRSPIIRVAFEDLLERPEQAFADLLKALQVDPAGASFRCERTLGDLSGFHANGHGQAYAEALAEGLAHFR